MAVYGDASGGSRLPTWSLSHSLRHLSVAGALRGVGDGSALAVEAALSARRRRNPDRLRITSLNRSSAGAIDFTVARMPKWRRSNKQYGEIALTSKSKAVLCFL